MSKFFRPVKAPAAPDVRYWHSCKLQNLNCTRFEQAVNQILNGHSQLVTPKREETAARG
ncbi:hypothetical protein GF420_11895 [candidate division GN15 bacterium]|nr:hypothetical protein [candidate division GN15 bacterium]